MSIVSITTNGSTRVQSPYNALFVEAARKLGGKWHAPFWEFDARDRARVVELCKIYYGSDGVTDDTVTLRIDWKEGESAAQGPITCHGRTIATAYGRDSGAKLADVVVLAGGFGSGGSMKNWYTLVSEGTTVLLRDFPRAMAEQLAATPHKKRVYSIEVEAPPVDRAALEAERAKLVARIAEIDAVLGAP